MIVIQPVAASDQKLLFAYIKENEIEAHAVVRSLQNPLMMQNVSP
jgi:hypothetical protein